MPFYFRSRHVRVCFFGYRWLVALATLGIFWAEFVSAEVPSDYVINYDQGYDTGYLVGYDYGFDLGFDRGTDEGTADGETEGYDAGWETVYWPAWETAYAAAVPDGKVVGFIEAFPAAAEEGYQWASEVHRLLTNPRSGIIFTNSFPNITAKLIDRWGDPNSWGNFGSSSSVTIFSGVWNREIDWEARYYKEGYDEGYDEGKTFGDQEGFDEAYPLAYEGAYEPAFDRGSEEGTFQGLLDGGEEGYDVGWTSGLGVGKSVGFQVGADLYVAGGKLGDLDPTFFVASYATNLTVAESVSVPEPTSLYLGFIGLTLALAKRCNRP